jgi:hypothetical protein
MVSFPSFSSQHAWLHAFVYATINIYKLKKIKDIIMAAKAKKSAKSDEPVKDLQTFIENVNKKDKPNGKKIRFAFTKRKR